MSKKKAKPAPPTVITLTLPVEGGLERTGTLVIERGEQGFLMQFEYSDLGGVMQAVEQAARTLNLNIAHFAHTNDDADAQSTAQDEPLIFGQPPMGQAVTAAELTPAPDGQPTIF